MTIEVPLTSLLGKARIRAAKSEGQALIEFGLISPVLFLLLLGIIQCGMLLNNWIVLTEAVRTGARQLSISRAPNIDACQSAGTLLKSSASNLDANSIAISYTVASSCTNLTEGSAATVSATYPCNLNILGVDYAPSCTLRAQTTERVE